eukprot:gene11834-8420_t
MKSIAKIWVEKLNADIEKDADKERTSGRRRASVDDPAIAEMEKALKRKVNERRGLNEPICFDDLQATMRGMIKKENDKRELENKDLPPTKRKQKISLTASVGYIARVKEEQEIRDKAVSSRVDQPMEEGMKSITDFDAKLRQTMIDGEISLQMLGSFDETPMNFVKVVTRTQTTDEAEAKKGKTTGVPVQKLHNQRKKFTFGTSFSALIKGPALVIFKENDCAKSLIDEWATKKHRAIVKKYKHSNVDGAFHTDVVLPEVIGPMFQKMRVRHKFGNMPAALVAHSDVPCWDLIRGS